MNILLWVLQVLAALIYGASDVMQIFMFDKISQEVATTPGSATSGSSWKSVLLEPLGKGVGDGV
jgi:hypothetical protein